MSKKKLPSSDLNPELLDSGTTIDVPITEIKPKYNSFNQIEATRNYGIADFDFHAWLDFFLRRKKTIILVATFVILLVAVYTAVTPPIYRSTALLELEKDSATSFSNLGDISAAQIIDYSEPEIFATQVSILKSRALAELLVSTTGLKPEAVREPGFVDKVRGFLRVSISWLFPSLQDVSSTESKKEALGKSVAGQVSAKRDGKSRLIEVSMDAESPEMAKKMLRAHVNNYLSFNLEKRRRIQKDASEWASKEMGAAEAKVLDSLAALVAFTSQHGVVSIDESTNHVLTFFQKAAEAVVRTTEQRLQVEALSKEGDSRAAAISGMRVPEAEGIYSKLSLLESEYAQMKELYSENSPKLVLLRKQIEFLRNSITDQQQKTVSAVLKTAKQQEQLSQEEFEKAKKKALDNKSLGVEYAVLKKEAETNEKIYLTLLTKAKELQLATQVIGNNIVEIEGPSTPSGAIKPRVALNLFVGSVFGLVLGVAAAFAQERLDKSVRDARDLEQMPLLNLGMVPNVDQLPKVMNVPYVKKELPAELIAWDHPTSPVAEAFALIRTSLSLSYSTNKFKVIMITSALRSEGKSFCSAALASSFAQGGKRVLLIEADMRRPRLAQVFGIKEKKRPVLSSILTSSQEFSFKTANLKSGLEGLDVITAGPAYHNAAQLLDSAAMTNLIKTARKYYDTVLVDSPPTSGLSDARILSGKCEGIIFVIRQGHTSVDLINSSIQALSGPNCGQILGTIFNYVDVSSSWVGSRLGQRYGSSYYYSYYHDYYGKDSNKLLDPRDL